MEVGSRKEGSFPGGNGNWFPDPENGAKLLRWFIEGQPTEWIADRAYPSLVPQSSPFLIEEGVSPEIIPTDPVDQVSEPPDLTSAGLSSADGEAAESFGSLRAVESELEVKAKRVSSHFRNSAGAIHQARLRFEKDVAERRRALENARTPKKLASVGAIRKAVLYENRIDLPGESHELTTGITAKAAQFGDKDVVQGWVIKTTHDRREVHLTIEGPDWSSVVSFRMEWSLSDTRDLHSFAAAVNQASKNAEKARTEIAHRVSSAKNELASALTSTGLARSAVEQAEEFSVEELLGQADRLSVLVDSFKEPEKRSERRILKSARNSAKSIRATAERQASDLDILSRQLQTDLHKAAREANSLRVKEPDPPTDSLSDDVAIQSNTPPNLETPDQGSTVAPSATLSTTEPRDRLTRLRELKELRDILTDEEFEAEKSRILAEE